ncbi:hypothetical protein Tco_0848020 [Tanacetum coccineum]
MGASASDGAKYSGYSSSVHSLEKAIPALAPQGQAHSPVKVGAQDPTRSLEMVVPVSGIMVRHQVIVDDDMTAETIK